MGLKKLSIAQGASLLASLVVLAIVPGSLSSASSPARIKNARQLFVDLKTTLAIQGGDLDKANELYANLVSNLPERGVAAELAPSLGSIFKLSSGICQLFAGEMTSTQNPHPKQLADPSIDAAIAQVYDLTLARSPEAQEVQAIQASLDPAGTQRQNLYHAYYASCLTATSNPEFFVLGE